MNSPVVLVSQDSRGRTEVRWYLDVEEWEAGRPIAVISASELWVDLELAPRDVKRMATRLSENEFESSANPDLSWLATHRQPVAGDPPQPIQPCRKNGFPCGHPHGDGHNGKCRTNLASLSNVDASNVRRLITEAGRDGAA